MSEEPEESTVDDDTSVAIVGMACRFPGAADLGQYWRNLRGGVESITRFTDEELRAAGVDEETLADPAYVKAAPVLDDVELFDASFFGFTPAEARISDPQQRLFLEVAWTALEAAGCDPGRFDGSVGVFTGSALSTYLLNNLVTNPGVAEWAGRMQLALGNDKDSLSTRVAYAFDLRGPSYGVQSYCSSSLVAVAAACTSLVAGECDAALAGGVSISVPHRVGYQYQEGGISSPDGHCRAFDADAGGAPLGNGVGAVVLKRLSDARADGDHVHAVIRGWAVNNDGGVKVGYTAPGVLGQAEVIGDAMANAGVGGADIDYVETHGTGTALGDAAEFAALRRAFGDSVEPGGCAIGSVKTNFGHLDRAAGVAGLIKTALALEHRELPPTLHFRAPNPGIDLAGSPFRVQTELAEWAGRGRPRRAGVSAFGIGGTNAHVVLEEAPAAEPTVPVTRPETLVLSARTAEAADARVRALAGALAALSESDTPLADVARTLQLGRAEFEHRRAVVVADRADAVAALGEPGWPRLVRGDEPVPGRSLGFVFAGGEDRPMTVPAGLVAELSAAEPVFADAVGEVVDRSGEVVPALGDVLTGAGEATLLAASLAEFVLQYALGRTLWRWGVRPDVLTGHGIGAYAAAVLAGVLSLPDALALLAFRAQLPEHAELDEAALTGWVREHLTPSPPETPYLSDLTGARVTGDEVTDPGYWAKQLRAPGRLAGQVGELGGGLDRGIVQFGGAADLVARHADASALVVRVGGNTSGDAAAALQTALAKLWAGGVAVDWAARDDAPRRRVPLPTYPFERRRYWVDPPSADRPDEPRLYAERWRPAEVPESDRATGPFLIFAEDSGLGAALAARVDAGVTVRAGEAFAELAEDSFTVRPGVAADHDRLVARLAELGRLPSRVVHLWGVTGADEDPASPETLRAHRIRGFDTLVCLVRSLAALAKSGVDITVVADHLHETGTPSPGKAAVLGACLVIPQEHPGFGCRSVDVTGQHGDLGDLAERLLTAPAVPAAAYRDGSWLTRSYTAAPPPAVEPPLRDGGAYLITGGLGSVGLLVAEHLANTARRPRLALVGRTGLPPRAEWPSILADEPDGTVARRVTRVLALEDLGAEVLVLAGGEPDTMEDAVRQAVRRFGALDGVVHAAGLTATDEFEPIQTLPGELTDRHFAAKVDSLLAVGRALAGRPAGFHALFSSMSTVLGGLGFAAYAAANATLDAFARYGAGSGQRWVSVDWDTWAPTAEQLDGLRLGDSMTRFSMSVAAGLAAFDRALVTGEPRVVVAVGDLEDRVRQWVIAEPARDDHGAPALSTGDYERRLTTLWRETLGIEHVGMDDNFFDLGGNSLMGLQLLKRVGREFGTNVPAVTLFQAPTVATLARHLAPEQEQTEAPSAAELERRRAATGRADTGEIAVIGMAGRFPGAPDIDRFWRNLSEGRESIRFFTDEELLAAGVPAEQLALPNYVKARPVLDDVDLFDAGFFGYSPKEATLTDPQQRVFLECCWHALEHAGYAGPGYEGLVGVFAGTNISTYLMRLNEAGQLDAGVSDYQVVIGNDKDSLTTAVSYKLDLTGPSMAVQTFCSTSLLAVHLGMRSLRSGESDVVLAGGVSIRVPDRIGHLYTEGGMESPDGHVRTFDAKAHGSMFGDGAGVVVLKRLADALADGDTVHAVLKGSAVNNDGALKVGFTAPSVAGQAAVVSRALADAGVDPATVSYVEAHGTATELGDPIEIAALTQAFGDTVDRQSCAIGSVKTNVGHLDRAAGVSGLIKVVLSLRHRELPPSLHYTAPNPEIDFAASPFYVNDRGRAWPVRADGPPRRAGVNSLGMGGTNVHVVVEEAPGREPASPGRETQLLVLSARGPAALDEATADLGRHLRENPDAVLADVAYTLQVGRGLFDHRRVVRCSGTEEAVKALEGADPARVLTRHEPRTTRPVGLLFAGVGEQYPGMATELAAAEPVFAAALGECAEVLTPLLGLDIREVLCGERQAPAADLRSLLGRDGAAAPSPADELLTRTSIAQPAVFAVEYALARLLLSWGLRPDAMAGYSLGEYVAATVAGVLSPPDALRLVAHRARLIDELPKGAMLAVSQSAGRVRPLIESTVDIAAVNSAGQCVLAGPTEVIERMAALLTGREIACRPLDTGHAFHSRLLEPITAELTAWVRDTVTLSEPRMPYVSNVTGTWITAAEATDPGYWARHMCGTVRFADAVGALLAEPDRLLLEVGPGQSLGAFVRQHPDCTPQRMALIVPTLPARHERVTGTEAVHAAQGRLWLSGVGVDWDAYHEGERRSRVPLPGYPFQRERYWIEERPAAPVTTKAASIDLSGDPRELLSSLPRKELRDWYYLPAWRQAVPPPAAEPPRDGPWLVFADAGPVADAVAGKLAGARIVRVTAGSGFAAIDDDTFTVRPGEAGDYTKLVDRVRPRHVLHLWTLDAPPADAEASRWLLDRGYFSLLWLAKALGQGGECDLVVATAGAFNVSGTDAVRPELGTVAGPCQMVPLELSDVRCRQVDVVAPKTPAQAGEIARRLLGELAADPAEAQVAWRGARRWLSGFEPLPAQPEPDTTALRERGVYLVTGGLGGIGLAIARGLARTVSARLVLLGRSAPPPRERWTALLADPATPEEVRRRIEAVRDLEAAGAEVLVCAADIADPEQTRDALAAAVDRFGALHGVVHAAGVPGMGLLQFKDDENAAIALRPKVDGTRVLLDCLAGREQDPAPDFVALFSSITSVTGGGPGQVDYCAANSYLDAVAQRAWADGDTRVFSIDWAEWRWNAWGAGLSGYAPQVQRFFEENRSRVGITFDEGWLAFLGALGAGQPQVIVSPQDFQVLAALSRWFTIETVLNLSIGDAGARHPRPELSTSYVSPGTDLERRIAGIWSDALGVADIGVHDNFFELGGNSLIGVDLIARIRRELDRDELTPHVLYLAPTVGALAHLAGDDADPAVEAGRMRDRRDRGALRRQGLRTRRNRS
ncbi:type I polyketide synthase [Amycolatopsis samaneae]|uniref:SDR family NAD(P)-dependent oxidoreductase n=1 Tax=Amycolatopsis samaneae TaxID=664691 RepID=A0ABW5GWQ6_9PSEU